MNVEVKDRPITCRNKHMTFNELPVGPFLHCGISWYIKLDNGGAICVGGNTYYSPEQCIKFQKDGTLIHCVPLRDDQELVITN